MTRDQIVLWAVALAWLAIYTASMLYHTGGRLALPLDDSFIYFQYARQAADGQFLQYNTGVEATAGATSILYMLLLVPGFWLGISGIGMVCYALLLGYIFLGLSAIQLFKIGLQLNGRFSAWIYSLLFLSCGPVLWGYYSGMEIGLFSFAILLTLNLFLAGDRRCPYAATLMILARPEGFVLVLWGLLLAVWQKYQNKDRWDSRWYLPFAAYGLQALLIEIYTGSPGASGLNAKWLFAAPHVSLPTVVRGILFDFAEFVKGLLAGSLGEQTSANLYAYDGNYRRMVFAPFAAFVFIAELSFRTWDEWQARRPGAAAIGGGWFIGGILVTCTLVEFDAHFNRYQQPFLPLFILFVGLGLGRLVAEGGEWGRKLGWGGTCIFGLWGMMSATYFAVAYGENCSDIRNQQIEMAHLIDGSLPPDARIAINDAGAIRYFGHRETIDLVGLTTAGNSGPWRHGSGSVFERLESMPVTRRPQYFAIFPNWFKFPEGVFLEPLHRIRVFAPSIVDAEKVLYRAHWDALQDGSKPHGDALPDAGWRSVDEVDIADLQSESRHAYQSKIHIPGNGEANLLLALPHGIESSALLMDGGRTVTGGERMRIELDPDKPALILMRTLTGIRQHFTVLADGVEVGKVDLPGGRGRQWLDLLIARLPANRKESTVEIETRPIHFAGDLRPVVSFHYWFMQQ